MRVKLDRTMCDGFGLCAKHAPEYFPLDDWGYASLQGDGNIPAADEDAVQRALLDCPVHAIMERNEHRPDNMPVVHVEEPSDPAETLKIEGNEAEWGFTR